VSILQGICDWKTIMWAVGVGEVVLETFAIFPEVFYNSQASSAGSQSPMYPSNTGIKNGILDLSWDIVSENKYDPEIYTFDKFSQVILMLCKLYPWCQIRNVYLLPL
jgi:hypothetical protein